MDKKNTAIGILLLILAGAAFYYSSTRAPAKRDTGSTPVPTNRAPSPAQTAAPATTPPDTTFAALATNNGNSTITTLSNDHLSLRFTNYGAAILDAALPKYPAKRESSDTSPYIFNKAHAAPILTLDTLNGADEKTAYELLSSTPTQVTYRAVIKNAVNEPIIEVTRQYTLPDTTQPNTDPYLIRHSTTFRNLTPNPLPLAAPTLNLGTASLLSPTDNGLHLNTATFNGSRSKFISPTDLAGGGFLSWVGFSNPPKSYLETIDAITWASVKNQFFASIYIPDEPASSLITRRIELPPLEEKSGIPSIGITGSLRTQTAALEPNQPLVLSGSLYIGPKEYTRLAKLPHEVDKVMQFDSNWYYRLTLCGYIAPFMNWLMVKMQSLVGNWGLAIICMTLLIKFITLPFTLAASRSAKRMQKLQPLMKEINEKYKDNQQKRSQATMELFKANKVNPAGGCIPIFITMPLFIAFFVMLQSTAELRFQSFLWNHDLSAPDTVWRLFGLPINIMPLLMGATMLYQMRLTPQPSVDSTQAKIFKFMPVFFTLICYNFSAALALYSTTNGIFTIVQQVLVNKLTKDTPTAQLPQKGNKSNKRLKNITPKK